MVDSLALFVSAVFAAAASLLLLVVVVAVSLAAGAAVDVPLVAAELTSVPVDKPVVLAGASPGRNDWVASGAEPRLPLVRVLLPTLAVPLVVVPLRSAAGVLVVV